MHQLQQQLPNKVACGFVADDVTHLPGIPSNHEYYRHDTQIET